MSRLPFSPPADQIRIDVEAASLEFTTRPGTTCDVDALRKAVRDAGFDLGATNVGGAPAAAP